MQYNSKDYFDPFDSPMNHITPSKIISYLLLGIFIIFCVVGLWIYFLGPTGIKKITDVPQSKGNFPRPIVFIRDSNVWILAKGSEKQITSDAAFSQNKPRASYTLRYSYPVISPDEKKIVFFQSKSSTIHLYLSDSDGKNKKMISDDDMFETTYPAIWLKDNIHVLIETYRPNSSGEHHLVKLNTLTGVQTVIGKYTSTTGCGGILTDPSQILGGLDNALPVYIKNFQLSVDENYVLHNTSCSGYGVNIFNIAGQEDLPVSKTITQAIFSHDGSKIAGFNKDKKILIFDTLSQKVILTLASPLQPQVMLWSNNGKTIYYATQTEIRKLSAPDSFGNLFKGAQYKASLMSIALDGAKVKNLQDFDSYAIRPIVLSDDGAALLLAGIDNPTKYYEAMTKGAYKNLGSNYPQAHIVKMDLETQQVSLVHENAVEAFYR